MSGQINTMKDIIGYAAETYGENPAIRYKVRKEVITKTYEDIKKDSEAFSRALDHMGMLGKHVAVIGPTTYEWIITYFGAANSGCVIVPLDAQLPAADVCELLDRADISVLVYDELRRDVAEMAAEKCPDIKCMVSMQAKENTENVMSLQELLKMHTGSFPAVRIRINCVLFYSRQGQRARAKGLCSPTVI